MKQHIRDLIDKCLGYKNYHALILCATGVQAASVMDFINDEGLFMTTSNTGNEAFFYFKNNSKLQVSLLRNDIFWDEINEGLYLNIRGEIYRTVCLDGASVRAAFNSDSSLVPIDKNSEEKTQNIDTLDDFLKSFTILNSKTERSKT